MNLLNGKLDMHSETFPHPFWESGFAYGRSETSPDSERISHTATQLQMRNSSSMEQIQDRARVRGYKAFTLAEVLITLGVIGVVAAITLPILVQNYQKKTYVEGLKVGMSIFEQGLKKAMADDGVDDLRNTELFKVCDATASDWNTDTFVNRCMPFLQKYFKGIKYESVVAMQALGDTTNITTDTAKCKQLVGKTNKWWYLNDKTKCRGWKNMAVTLANGMRADFGLADFGSYAGIITALDVNGSKGPNTWGRDTFCLRILNDGHIAPAYGVEHYRAEAKYNNVEFNDEYLAGQTNYWKNADVCSKTTTEEGVSCAARVVESGWKMDY